MNRTLETSNRDDTKTGRIRLPLVIRPTLLRLRDVEQRAARDAAFASALRKRPELCAALARALLLRDLGIRHRFGDSGALADHLGSLPSS